MPFVNVKMYKGRSKQVKKELAKKVTEVVSKTLQVSEDVVWVVIEDVPPDSWMSGGRMGDEK